MEAEEQIAQLKKEKAEVECQLEEALRRIVELEEQWKRQEERFEERLMAERESFQGQMGRMQSQIEEIKKQTKKDSHNSHKPPSSDGLRRKTHSRRKPSGRKSGGQNGHTGETRALSQEVDKVVSHRPE